MTAKETDALGTTRLPWQHLQPTPSAPGPTKKHIDQRTQTTHLKNTTAAHKGFSSFCSNKTLQSLTVKPLITAFIHFHLVNVYTQVCAIFIPAYTNFNTYMIIN